MDYYSLYNAFFTSIFFSTFLIIFIISTIISGAPLYVIAKRANLKNPIFAFIPILNIVLISHLAGVNFWKYLGIILLSFIPVIGFFISLGCSVYISERICKNFNLNSLCIVLYIFVPFLVQLYIVFTQKEFVGIIPEEYKN